MTTVASKPKAYLKVRQKTVRESLAKLNLDSLLLTLPADIAYLTNFTGDDSIALITPSDLILVTDFRYKEQAQIEAGWLKAVIRDGKMETALAETMLGSKAKRVGFEANRASFGQIHALDKAIKEKAGKEVLELVPVEDLMVNIRKVKDDHEIALIRKAAAIAEEAFTAVREEIKVGQTENYYAGLLIFEIRSRGASDASFPVIIGRRPQQQPMPLPPRRRPGSRRPAPPLRLGRTLRRLLQRHHPNHDAWPSRSQIERNL